MEASDLAIRMVEFVESRPLSRQTRSTTDSPAATQQGTSSSHSASASTKMEGGIASGGYDSPAPMVQHSLPPPPEKGSSAAALPAIPAAISYGPAPAEPAETDAGVIKVSIKLVSGKTSVRRYLSSDAVQGLFAVVAGLEPEAAAKEFDLVTRYPALSLAACREKTLGECSLAGVQVIMKWV